MLDGTGALMRMRQRPALLGQELPVAGYILRVDVCS
jgi:hypothetical protein